MTWLQPISSWDKLRCSDSDVRIADSKVEIAVTS